MITYTDDHSLLSFCQVVQRPSNGKEKAIQMPHHLQVHQQQVLD